MKELAPREASVHFLLGKVYKRLENPDQAMIAYLSALDLDPKDRNLVCVCVRVCARTRVVCAYCVLSVCVNVCA